MICSVCLNPCIDRTVEIDAFAYGGLNRIRASRSDGCGKGVNVALVAREMGMEASVIGFLFEENGRCIAARLERAVKYPITQKTKFPPWCAVEYAKNSVISPGVTARTAKPIR